MGLNIKYMRSAPGFQFLCILFPGFLFLLVRVGFVVCLERRRLSGCEVLSPVCKWFSWKPLGSGVAGDAALAKLHSEARAWCYLAVWLSRWRIVLRWHAYCSQALPAVLSSFLCLVGIKSRVAALLKRPLEKHVENCPILARVRHPSLLGLM